MNLLSELRARFVPALASWTDDPRSYTSLIKVSQDAKFGDYQANFAMPLAKLRSMAPRDLAQQVVAAVDLADLCESPEVAGPGFINLRLKDTWLAEAATKLVSDERLGVVQTESPRKVVIDYSSPNVAKPMHVGHLRSTVIGNALDRLLRFLGHAVVSDNHVGDWGTQFGMILYGYKHFLNQDLAPRDLVGELSRLYRLVNQLSDFHEARAALPGLELQLAEARQARTAAESTPTPPDKQAAEQQKKRARRLSARCDELQEEIASACKKRSDVEADPELLALASSHPHIARLAREETARLHAGDPENFRLWREFVPQCLAAIQRVYDRLDIHFDHTLGESFYQPFLADVVADLRQRGLAVDSEGATCVFISGFEAPFIIRKRDGAFTYATTDLATIRYRVEHFHAESLLYVVDARQADHFKLLFETARRWSHDRLDLQHISFGTILGEDKRPFKTRSGDAVGLESLLDESVLHARKIVDANDDQKPGGRELDEATRQEIAEVVGLGAIKYADLGQNRESDYIFSWEKMLNKNGDTATYMQYAYARVCGIFRKGNVSRAELRQQGGRVLISHPAERALIMQLLRLSEVFEQAGAELRPNYITSHLFATANSFSTFFENCDVLRAASDDLRTSRLLLTDLTGRAIQLGLNLLGIQTVERM